LVGPEKDETGLGGIGGGEREGTGDETTSTFSSLFSSAIGSVSADDGSSVGCSSSSFGSSSSCS